MFQRIPVFKFVLITLLMSLLSACSNTDPADTSAEDLASDVTNLQVSASNGDSLTAVSGNLTLATQGESGSTIIWQSSNPNVIATDGTVTQPTYGSGDASVTLTATITNGDSTETLTFTITVLEAEIIVGVDTNNDGTSDGQLIDADGDGQYDGIDSNGDGVVDVAMNDLIGAIIDMDGDGIFGGIADGVVVDINGDGVADGVDSDADGTADVDIANLDNSINGATITLYSIGGSVSGLATGNSVVLQNNAGDNLTVSADGNFSFASLLDDSGTYAVTVLTQPTTPNQTCSVTNNGGTISAADITNVTVTCVTNTYNISGTISGLTRAADLSLGGETITLNSDGGFAFTTAQNDGGSYTITAGASMHQTCNIPSVTLSGADVTDVSIACRGIAYFPGNNGVNGDELWRTDGTANGTYMIKNINTINEGAINIATITAMLPVGELLYFVIDDGSTYGAELWKTNGTEAGTVLVKDIWVGSSSSNPTGLTDVNGVLFFAANDGNNGKELWTSDGTAAGTVLVKDINTNVSTSSLPEQLINVNGTLYFRADDGTNGNELWKSDGTTAGTVMVKDISSGVAGSFIMQLTNFNGTLFFSAHDGSQGYELWKSDGTTAGTQIVLDINSAGDGFPEGLTVINSTLYFSATDANGTELWKTGGTSANTVLVKDIISGITGSFPLYLTNFNGTLFFRANDGTNGTELWKSDGTDAGTVMVKDINTGVGNGNPFAFTPAGDSLYFSAYDATSTELWITDGTTAGTTLVKRTDQSPINFGASSLIDDIYQNLGYDFGTFFWAGGSTIYYSGTDGFGTDGYDDYEPWISDGTSTGTLKIKSLNASGDGVGNTSMCGVC